METPADWLQVSPCDGQELHKSVVRLRFTGSVRHEVRGRLLVLLHRACSRPQLLSDSYLNGSGFLERMWRSHASFDGSSFRILGARSLLLGRKVPSLLQRG